MSPTKAKPKPAAKQTITPTSITTLTSVVVTIDCTADTETIVITRVPSGDQIRVPMSSDYATSLRQNWNRHLAELSRNGADEYDPED